jgi:hypothetical protein
MIELFGQGRDHHYKSLEEIWTTEYELYEVTLAFHRARIRGAIRNIARWTRGFSSNPASVAEGSLVRSREHGFHCRRRR